MRAELAELFAAAEAKGLMRGAGVVVVVERLAFKAGFAGGGGICIVCEFDCKLDKAAGLMLPGPDRCRFGIVGRFGTAGICLCGVWFMVCIF